MIGTYCLFLPDIAKFLCSLQTPIYETMLASRLITTAIRFTLALGALLPATVAMGGTLPLLAKYCTTRTGRIGSQISLLYAVNTTGAALGAYLSGFHLIEYLGVSATTALAALVNVIIGIMALFLSSPIVVDEAESSINTSEGDDGGLVRYLLIATAVCGFTSLGLEICWNRFLPLVIGSSTYSFSLILIAFLCGLAAGSFYISRIEIDADDVPMLAGTLMIIVIVSVSISLPIFGFLPELFVLFRKAVSLSFSVFLSLQFLGIFVLFIVPTSCFGALFPLIAQYSSRMENVGSQVGRVYWWNTLGTVIGVISTGFILIPSLGIKLSMVTLQLLLLLVASLLFHKNRMAPRRVITVTIGTALIMVVFSLMTKWDEKVLTSGVFRYWDTVRGSVASREKNSKLLFYRETHSGVVSVQQYGETLSLKLNGKPDASSGGDMVTQLLLSYLPLAIADNKEKVMIVGMGSGVTAGACLDFEEVQRVDVVELLPAVNEASRLFAQYNKEYWNDGRVRIIEEDARNFVTFCPEEYDVIISEPSNPWFVGVGNLMTLEAFQSFASRLRSGGIMVQHVHCYENSQETVNTILTTFNAVFDNCSIWQLSMGDTLVLGQKDGKILSSQRIGQLFQNREILTTLKSVGLDSEPLLLSLEMVSSLEFDNYIGRTLLNEDDFPIVEFLAPVHFYDRCQVTIDPLERVFANPSSLLNKSIVYEKISARDWATMARHWEKVSVSSIALSLFERAVEANPQNFDVRRDYLEKLIKDRRWQRAFDIAKEICEVSHSSADYIQFALAARELDLSMPSLKNGAFLLRHFEEVLRKWKNENVSNWEPLYAEGVAYRKFDGSRSVAVLEEAAKEVLLDKNSVSVQRGRVFLEWGKSLLANREFKESAEAFVKAIELGTDSIKREAKKELSLLISHSN